MAQTYATVTWDQLHRDARALAAALMPLGPFRGIVARELDCRLVESVAVLSYDDETLKTPTLLKPPSAAGTGEGFLIIDDLVDTGSTARLVRELLPHAHFACLYAKPAGQSLADTWVADVPQDTWILFPWDTEAQFVAPLAKRETLK